MTDPLDDSADREPMPPSHLGLALASTVLCQVCGVVALVYAAQVASEWKLGQYELARRSSARAKAWAWWGLALSLLLVAVFAFAAVAAWTDWGSGAA